jgi:hypothetical protein
VSLRFDDSGCASLDGVWDFFPGDHGLDALDGLDAGSIEVPGLWEAQGWLELDGVAWYRRTFTLDSTEDHWTLRFGAVMDLADVFLNGTLLGTHDSPFTPFELDAGPSLRQGENVLAVRVCDPSLSDPEHLLLPHGKQGWNNTVFPSRPSLYMTYGGIWQTVTLRRHGPLAIADVFVNGDPDDLAVTVEVRNAGALDVTHARLTVRTLAAEVGRDLDVPAGCSATAEFRLGPSQATRWSPAEPALHHALVDVHVNHALSDTTTVRYGLRTIRVDGTRLLLNGEPYRMKSALVQGFRAEELYAEGPRETIVDEVRQALAMGFNTLRLHIKAFDPTYLDVCDELGMLLHCDLPVAEPIDHEAMGDDTPLARNAVRAIQEQVRRDRNHPSVILWSAMNEICDGRREARAWPRYERFARTLYAAVRDCDPTRPVIENDWIEPDPDRVFVSPILTAHWYGRMHRDYLAKIDGAAAAYAGTGRPLFVTEFGDWGLPEMPLLHEPPFWDTREVHARGLAGTEWPGTIASFVIETHRYQGLSDRMQAEVFRRHDHIGGYCLTELTDVPHELNGLLDIHRRPKPLAVQEIRRANQVVLPMLRLDSLVVATDQVLAAEVHIANDGPPLPDVTVDVRFGDFIALGIDQVLAVDASGLSAEAVAARFEEEKIAALRVGDVDGFTVRCVGEVTITAPEVPGSHDLVVRLRSGRRQIAENRYPLHVVDAPEAPVRVRLLGGMPCTDAAIRVLGATAGNDGPLVVGEGALDAEMADDVRRLQAEAGVVLVLAQGPDAAAHFPVPVRMEPLGTYWGSSIFQFTTDEGAIPSLPRRAVLVAEDSTIQATNAITRIGERPFPDTPVVVAYKPVPGAVTGTVLGSTALGGGRMIFCQYRLCDAAAEGDVAARAVLADLLRWAAVPRRVMIRETERKDDGRSLRYYSCTEERGR